jgi:hypothetical protein
LREKDTLIQDNLIRFSTFLQQQEQRKKKDEELAKIEILVGASVVNALEIAREEEGNRKEAVTTG